MPQKRVKFCVFALKKVVSCFQLNNFYCVFSDAWFSCDVTDLRIRFSLSAILGIYTEHKGTAEEDLRDNTSGISQE